MRIQDIVTFVVNAFQTGITEDAYYNMRAVPHLSVGRVDQYNPYPKIRPLNAVGQAVLSTAYIRRWWPGFERDVPRNMRGVVRGALCAMEWGREISAARVVAALIMPAEGWAAFPAIGGGTMALWEQMFPQHQQFLDREFPLERGEKYKDSHPEVAAAVRPLRSHPRKLDFCVAIASAQTDTPHTPPENKAGVWDYYRAYMARINSAPLGADNVPTTAAADPVGPLSHNPFAGLRVE